MTNPAVMNQRAERDGCDCPPWVMRCVHYGANIWLFIGDRRRIQWVNGIPSDVYESPWRAWRCGTEISPGPLNCLYAGNDYDAALAAFHEAEEQLLRGQA